MTKEINVNGKTYSNEEIEFIVKEFFGVVLKHYAQASAALGITPKEHVVHMTTMVTGIKLETNLDPHWPAAGGQPDVDA